MYIIKYKSEKPVVYKTMKSAVKAKETKIKNLRDTIEFNNYDFKTRFASAKKWAHFFAEDNAELEKLIKEIETAEIVELC